MYLSICLVDSSSPIKSHEDPILDLSFVFSSYFLLDSTSFPSSYGFSGVREMDDFLEAKVDE